MVTSAKNIDFWNPNYPPTTPTTGLLKTPCFAFPWTILPPKKKQTRPDTTLPEKPPQLASASNPRRRIKRARLSGVWKSRNGLSLWIHMDPRFWERWSSGSTFGIFWLWSCRWPLFIADSLGKNETSLVLGHNLMFPLNHDKWRKGISYSCKTDCENRTPGSKINWWFKMSDRKL